MTGPVGAEETERFGRRLRHYKMSISAGVLALAWARQENAPHGATVVVDREVSPLGRHGEIWPTPPEATLACSMVLRPRLSPDEADVAWLVVTHAAAVAAEAVSGRPAATWWPDAVHGDDGERLAATKAEVQLGPGQIRSAVVTARIDLERLGVGPDGRDPLLEAFAGSIDEISDQLATDLPAAVAAFQERCSLVGRRVKIRLLPKGETRGVVGGIDRMARLELQSGTGMVERVSIDMLRQLEVV